MRWLHQRFAQNCLLHIAKVRVDEMSGVLVLRIIGRGVGVVGLRTVAETLPTPTDAVTRAFVGARSVSETVPMLPRYSKVEKVLWAGMPSVFKIVSRCRVPTW